MTGFFRFYILLTGITFSFFITSAFAQTSKTVEIQGRILNAETEEPIPFANVRLVETQLGSSTNEEGNFKISKIPPGTYTLRASCVGYKEVILKDVRIDSETDQHFKLILTPVAHQLKEITVTPGTFSFMETGSSTRQTMSREDIESVPQFGEDIFRAVNRLPGLSSGDFSAHFSIRGGRYDETLIMLDGLEIYEPYHLKDFNEGAISIIDAETIEGVELMTGGFPAEYGNRISGVFNMTSRKSRVDRPKYSVGLSFMYARAKAEGTFANNKGSWLFSARRGYLDLVFTIMRQNDLPSPKYYDIFGKIDYDLNPRHNLSINMLRAGDKYSYNANGTTGFRDTINTKEIANNKYGNSYAWVTLKSALGQRASVRTMASAGLVTKDRDGTEKYTNIPDAVYALTNKRDFTILGLKQDWAFELSNSIFLESGMDFKRVDADDNFINYVGKNPDDPTADATGYYPVETRTRLKKNGTLLGLYLSNRFQILEPFTLELGGRYDRASYTKDSDFSPRVNALFRLAERSNLRLGWGTYRQMQSIEDVTVLNGQDRYHPSERSRQWTAGLEHGFVNGAKLRVEGYYKRGSNLRPTYRNWVSAPDIFPETNEDRILVYPDKSTSRGMEVYFTQNIGKKLSIRGSYALAKVEEQVSRVDNVNDPLVLQFDRKHPNLQDQRHALNLDCTYRPNDAWSINLSYAFHAGWPATLQGMFEVTGDDGHKDFAVRPLKLYGGKLPAYQRLDVRATKRFSTSRGDVRFFFEVVNLTNHSNVFAYDYFKVRSNNGDFRLQRDIEKWFIILPSIGISWSGGF